MRRILSNTRASVFLSDYVGQSTYEFIFKRVAVSQCSLLKGQVYAYFGYAVSL